MNIVFTMADGSTEILYDVEFGGTLTLIPKGATHVSVFLPVKGQGIYDLYRTDQMNNDKKE